MEFPWFFLLLEKNTSRRKTLGRPAFFWSSSCRVASLEGLTQRGAGSGRPFWASQICQAKGSGIWNPLIRSSMISNWDTLGICDHLPATEIVDEAFWPHVMFKTPSHSKTQLRSFFAAASPLHSGQRLWIVACYVPWRTVSGKHQPAASRCVRAWKTIGRVWHCRHLKTPWPMTMKLTLTSHRTTKSETGRRVSALLPRIKAAHI